MKQVNHHALTATYIAGIKPQVFMNGNIETTGIVNNIYRCCPSAAFVDEELVREMITHRAQAIWVVMVVLSGGVYEEFNDNSTVYALVASLMFGNVLTKNLPLSRSDYFDIIAQYATSLAEAQASIDVADSMQHTINQLYSALDEIQTELLSGADVATLLTMAGVRDAFSTTIQADEVELVDEIRIDILDTRICNRLNDMDKNLLKKILGTEIPKNLAVGVVLRARLEEFGVSFYDFSNLEVVEKALTEVWVGFTSFPEQSDVVDVVTPPKDLPISSFDAGLVNTVFREMRKVFRTFPTESLNLEDIMKPLQAHGVPFLPGVSMEEVLVVIQDYMTDILCERICDKLDAFTDQNYSAMVEVMETPIPQMFDVGVAIIARLFNYGVTFDEFEDLDLVSEAVAAYWEGFTGNTVPDNTPVGTFDEDPIVDTPVDEFVACVEGFRNSIKMTPPAPPANPAVDLMCDLAEVVEQHTSNLSSAVQEQALLAIDAVVGVVYPEAFVEDEVVDYHMNVHAFEFTAEFLIEELYDLTDETISIDSVSDDGIDFHLIRRFGKELAPRQFLTTQQVQGIIVHVVYCLSAERDIFALVNFRFDEDSQTFKGELHHHPK